MKVRIKAYLGGEGYAERFAAERETEAGWVLCEVRWAPKPMGEDVQHRLARVKDAGLLLKRHPDPLIPTVYAVAPAWGGIAVFADHPGGHALRTIPEGSKPVAEGAFLEIIRQVAGLLDRLYRLVDPTTGKPMHLLHRSISADRIHLRPDGALRVTGFDEMTANWSFREAETSMMALHPGSRLAPEQVAGQNHHTTDIYLLGLVAVDLLVGMTRASRFSRSLAMCICDPEGFIEIRDELLEDPALGLSRAARELLRGMLQEDPSLRPDGATVTRQAAAAGASPELLAALARTLGPVTLEEAEPHDFVGRAIKVKMEPVRPAVPAGSAAPVAPLVPPVAGGRTIVPQVAPPVGPAAGSASQPPPVPVGLSGRAASPVAVPAPEPRASAAPARPIKIRQPRQATPPAPSRAAAPVAPPAPSPQPAAAPPPAVQAAHPTEPPAKSRMPLLVGMGCVLLLLMVLCAGVAGYFLPRLL